MNADESAASQSPLKRTTRSRVIQACMPCHRSKRKCNRRKPCSQCLKRRITGNCIYEALAAEDLSALEDSTTPASRENEILRSRVAELEAVVAELRDHRRDQAQSTNQRRKRRISEVLADKDGIYYGQSFYLDGPAAPDLLHRMISLVPNEQSDLLFAFSGGSDHRQAESTQSTNIFQTVFSSNHGVAEMQQLLSSLGRCHLDVLLAAFIETVDPLHHYIPTQWIWQRFENCVSTSTVPQPQEIALIFSVLALGDLVSTKRCPNVLMAGAMHLLRVANFLTSPSIDAICTFCFIAVYLQHEGRLNEYWPLLGMVIRMAQSMGLHRDPKMIQNLTLKEGEVRRRVFHVIAAQETALSVMFGRPNGLGLFDCEIPRDISDEELYDSGSVSKASYPFQVSYNRHTWQLMDITREVFEGSFDTGAVPLVARAKVMEAKILKWYESLASPLRHDHAIDVRKLQDARSRAHYVQSLDLRVVVQHNILVLYRKPLLMDSSSESAIPCFQAAIAIAESWTVLQDFFPKMAMVTLMHWFRAFHAALICLVAIRATTTPSDIRARSIRCWNSCLRTFRQIQDQNESTKCCYRALNRLDQVVRESSMSSRCDNSLRDKHSAIHSISRTMETIGRNRADGAAQNFGITSQSSIMIADLGMLSTSQTDDAIGFSTSADSRCRTVISRTEVHCASKPKSHSPVGYGQAFESFVLEPPKSDNADVPISNATPADVPQLNIFDMDTTNWPNWLIEAQNPIEGLCSDNDVAGQGAVEARMFER